MEDGLEREKRQRQEIEKSKRKIEGELKLAQENIDELNKQKHDLENNIKRFQNFLINLKGFKISTVTLIGIH